MIYKKRNIMKKILLFTVFSLLMQSCLFEEENYFEEPASARVEEKITETKNLLSSHTNGWILHYFPDLSFGGHNYAISFAGEQAKIACETEVVGTGVRICDPVYTDSCMYDIIPEQGAILTFNTYSKLMHQFRNPSSAAYQGLGGDYEFILTGVKPDEIKLKGKTTGNIMRMFPLPDGHTSKESYIETVQEMSAKANGIFKLYCDDVDLGVFVQMKQGNRVINYEYEETVDGETGNTVAEIPFIYTPEGFTVYHVHTSNAKKDITSASPEQPVFDPLKEYSEFVYDSVNYKTFTSKDGTVKLVEDFSLTGLFSKGENQWIFDWTNVCSELETIYNTAYEANDSEYGESLETVYIGYDDTGFGITPNVFAFMSLWELFPGYSFEFWSTYGVSINPVRGTTDQIHIRAVGGDGSNWSYYTYFEPIVDFFVDNSPWRLAPLDEDSESVKMVSVKNDALWAVVKRK
jgi:hypothetical protein